jgi:Kef-type K+ transport system membrane component KefB
VNGADPIEPLGAHSLLIFLLQLGLLLLVAVALGRLALRCRMPAIVGELCAGVLLGPSVLGHSWPAAERWLFPGDAAQFHLLDAVGQVGVLLLVGITGIEMDLRLMRRRAPAAASLGLAGLLVPLGLGVGMGLILPGVLIPASAERSTFALFLGVAMGVSAIPVLAKTLMELRLIDRNIGQLTICAVMISDILGWLLLSVVGAMAVAGVRAGTVAIHVAAIAGVVVAALLVRPVVRAVLRLTDRSDAGATVAVVVVLVLLSAAGTQALHLEAVFGALVCGMLISSCGVRRPARLDPLRTTVLSVLAPIFFAMAGLRIDLAALRDPTVLLIGLAVLAVAVLGKFAGAAIGGLLARLGRAEMLALGAGMNARGVIEVIVAMVGLRLGVLGMEMYTIIVLVAIVTSLMAPPILRIAMERAERTAESRLRDPDPGPRPDLDPQPGLDPHPDLEIETTGRQDPQRGD